MARQRVAGFVFANTRSEADTARPPRADGSLAGQAALRRQRIPGRAAAALCSRRRRSGGVAFRAVTDRRPAGRGDRRGGRGHGGAARFHPRPRHVDVPCLVLTSSEDTLIPPQSSLAMADHISHAQAVTLTAAGHLSNLEAPEAFSDALRTSSACSGPPDSGGVAPIEHRQPGRRYPLVDWGRDHSRGVRRSVSRSRWTSFRCRPPRRSMPACPCSSRRRPAAGRRWWRSTRSSVPSHQGGKAFYTDAAEGALQPEVRRSRRQARDRSRGPADRRQRDQCGGARRGDDHRGAAQHAVRAVRRPQRPR